MSSVYLIFFVQTIERNLTERVAQVGEEIYFVSIHALASWFTVIAILFSSLLFLAMKHRVTTGSARKMYNYLFIAWILYFLTFLLAALRIYARDESLSAIDSLFFKIEGAFFFTGAIFNGISLSIILFPEEAKKRKIVTSFNNVLSVVALFSWLVSRNKREELPYGTEWIPETWVIVIVFITLFSLGILHLVSCLYNARARVKLQSERNKVTLLGFLGFAWYILQFSDASGLFATFFGVFTFIFIRVLIAFTSIALAITWIGRDHFRDIIKRSKKY